MGQPKVANKPENVSSTEDLEPERTTDEAMQDYWNRYLNAEQELYKPLKPISVGRLENSKKINDPPETIDLEKDKVKQTMLKEEKSKDTIIEHSDNNKVSKMIEDKKVTPEMPKSQKSNTPEEKNDTVKETSIPKGKNIIQQSI